MPRAPAYVIGRSPAWEAKPSSLLAQSRSTLQPGELSAEVS
jgi:hypothetical protein